MEIKKSFTKNTVILLVAIFFLFSCEQNEEIPINPENLLIGFWANAAYDNEEITFSRTAALPNTAYGISFEENGVFTEKTSGFCGTPPLTFFTIDGNWELENTLIKIKTPNYYPTRFNWRIISLSQEKLTVKRELSEQEKDHQEIMRLFNEFNAMSSNYTCTNFADWDFVAYGAKACGGPQGYVAYNKVIDVTTFLDSVKAYTEAEKRYNIKWGIISTCDSAPTPTSIKCSNGFPVLVY